MVKKTKERIAFWLLQSLTLAVTVASIYFASQIGYDLAVRYAQWKEDYQALRSMQSMEQELVLNRSALQEALSNWDSEAFTELFVSTRAYQRTRAGEEYFQLDQQTLAALSHAYAPSLKQLIDAMRQQIGGPASRSYARVLRHHMERMVRAESLLHGELERFKEKLSRYKISLPEYETTWQQAGSEKVGAVVTANPVDAMLPAASTQWQSVKPRRYNGEIAEMSWQQLATPPVEQGPAMLSYSMSFADIPNGATPERLILFLFREAPLPMGTIPSDDLARRVMGGDIGTEVMIFKHEFGTIEGRRIRGEIVDPNQPLSWNWALLLIEDQDGNRYPVTYLDAWRIGEGPAWEYWAKPSGRAVVLPKDYDVEKY